MARPGPETQAKRRREQAKKEKRRAKEEKRALRKALKNPAPLDPSPPNSSNDIDQDPE